MSNLHSFYLSSEWLSFIYLCWKWNLFHFSRSFSLSVSLSRSVCTNRHNTWRLSKKKKNSFTLRRWLSHSSTFLPLSLFIIKQRKKEWFFRRAENAIIVSLKIFFPFFFSIRIELCKQTENESGSEYAPLSMTRIQSTSKACRYSFIQRMTYSIFDSNSRVSKTTKIFHQLDKRRKNPFVNDTKDVIGKMISSMS